MNKWKVWKNTSIQLKGAYPPERKKEENSIIFSDWTNKDSNDFVFVFRVNLD